jgi:plasmid maintenance system killer protein
MAMTEARHAYDPVKNPLFEKMIYFYKKWYSIYLNVQFLLLAETNNKNSVSFFYES